MNLLFGGAFPPTGTLLSISGTVFLDSNVNGQRDAGEGAPTKPLIAYIDLNNNGIMDSLEPSASVSYGQFALINFAPGRYRLRLNSSYGVLKPSTYSETDGVVLNITSGQTLPVDIGVYQANAVASAFRSALASARHNAQF